jgi:hypothetical protein
MRGLGLALVCFAAVMAVAATQELNLPWGPVKRLASPDGSKILYGVPYEKSKSGGPQLWIEDKSAHLHKKLFDIGGTLSAAWSADGAAFYVDDHWASDREDAYIYDAYTLKRMDIGAMIRAADPGSQRFAKGHAYYEIDRWVGPQYVAVRFFGHSDIPPVSIFEFRYAISRYGAVEKAGQRISAR